MLAVMAKHPRVDRVEWILANRTKPNGNKISKRWLSGEAGMSDGYIEQLTAGRIDAAEMAESTLRGIARAGNVRTEWLATGREPREPYEGDAVETGPAPAAGGEVPTGDSNRDALAEVLEGRGAARDIVAQLRRQPPRPTWRMRDWVTWVEELQSAERLTPRISADHEAIPALEAVQFMSRRTLDLRKIDSD